MAFSKNPRSLPVVTRLPARLLKRNHRPSRFCEEEFAFLSPACEQSQICGRSSRAGFTIAEVLIAGVLILVVMVSTAFAMMQMNRAASAARTRTCAEQLVQGYIEQVMAVNFTPTNVPACLQTTSSAGEATNVDIVVVGDTGTPAISGTLTRIVTNQSNAMGAVLRNVTYRIDYVERGVSQSYEMSTLRAAD